MPEARRYTDPSGASRSAVPSRQLEPVARRSSGWAAEASHPQRREPTDWCSRREQRTTILFGPRRRAQRGVTGVLHQLSPSSICATVAAWKRSVCGKSVRTPVSSCVVRRPVSASRSRSQAVQPRPSGRWSSRPGWPGRRWPTYSPDRATRRGRQTVISSTVRFATPGRSSGGSWTAGHERPYRGGRQPPAGTAGHQCPQRG